MSAQDISLKGVQILIRVGNTLTWRKQRILGTEPIKRILPFIGDLDLRLVPDEMFDDMPRIDRILEIVMKFFAFLRKVDCLYPPHSEKSLEKRGNLPTSIFNVQGFVLDLLGRVDEDANALFDVMYNRLEKGINHPDHIRDPWKTDPKRPINRLEASVTALNQISDRIPAGKSANLWDEAQRLDEQVFNAQADISSVGNVALLHDCSGQPWLQKRLGEAITQRRRYISYITNPVHELRDLLLSTDWKTFESDADAALNIPKTVFGSIRAYVCPYPGCDTPPFENVQVWFNHWKMDHDHDITYRCRYCSHSIEGRPDGRNQLISHLRNTHPEKMMTRELERGTIRYVEDFKIIHLTCPFCSDAEIKLPDPNKYFEDLDRGIQDYEDHHELGKPVDYTNFGGHVAAHLERLALYSVSSDLRENPPLTSLCFQMLESWEEENDRQL